MRRALLSLLLLPVALGASGATAAPSPPLALSVSGQNIQQPVEQESPNFFDCGGAAGPIYCPFDPSTWVGNPTSCAWDVDDWIDVTGTGVLSGTAVGSVCVVADGYDHFGQDNHNVWAQVIAASPSVSVSLSNDQGYSETAAPVANGHGDYLYRICHTDLTGYPSPPDSYPVIAGSNGGTGIPVTYTLTISSAKKLNGVRAVLQTGLFIYSVC